jgi:peroxiredoxin
MAKESGSSKKGSSPWRRVGGWIVLAGIVLVLAYAMRTRYQGGPISAPGDRHDLGDFTALDVNGKPWRLIDHRGQVVLLNLFATWCPPCQEETPGLVAVSRKYADQGVRVVGVSLDEGGRDVLLPFIQQYKIPYPILLPPDNSPFAQVETIPITFLIDREGRVAKRYDGPVNQATFEHDIKQVLAST